MLRERKKMLLIVSSFTLVSFFLILYLSILETPEYRTIIEPYRRFETFTFYPIRIHPLNLFLSSALLTIAVVSISYYFISKKLEKRLDVILKFLKEKTSLQKSEETNEKEIVLKFLNPGERRIIEILIEKNGEALQSTISRIGDMDKLKTHRAVINLERKNIIKRERFGKTYRIVLSKDVKEFLLKKFP